MSDPLEKVIRPIVEGQIRGFVKEHPSILSGVTWFKPRTDKSATLVNSLAKRIVRDLLCPVSRGRIEEAMLEIWEAEKLAVAPSPAVDSSAAGTVGGHAVSAECGTLSASEVARLALPTGRAAALPNPWLS